MKMIKRTIWLCILSFRNTGRADHNFERLGELEDYQLYV